MADKETVKEIIEYLEDYNIAVPFDVDDDESPETAVGMFIVDLIEYLEDEYLK